MSIHPEKSNKRKFLGRSKGFTLVEALVTLVILSTALGPSLILTSNITKTSTRTKNNLIAANLAQEGVEVIRSIRDTNWFTGNSFDQGLADGSYRVEWDSASVMAMSSNPPLKESGGLYGYTSGVDTLFKRTVSIYKANSSELRVISEVTWPERGVDRSVKIESHLF